MFLYVFSSQIVSLSLLFEFAIGLSNLLATDYGNARTGGLLSIHNAVSRVGGDIRAEINL